MSRASMGSGASRQLIVLLVSAVSFTVMLALTEMWLKPSRDMPSRNKKPKCSRLLDFLTQNRWHSKPLNLVAKSHVHLVKGGESCKNYLPSCWSRWESMYGVDCFLMCWALLCIWSRPGRSPFLYYQTTSVMIHSTRSIFWHIRTSDLWTHRSSQDLANGSKQTLV